MAAEATAAQVVVATWNARRNLGVGARKSHGTCVAFLDELKADLVVIPEYGRGGLFRSDALTANRREKQNGLAVLCNAGAISLIQEPTDRLPCVLAVEWQAPNFEQAIRLLAVWATDYDTQSLLTTWFALDEWSNWLAEGPALLIGDLNQSTKWDACRPLNFSDLIERLARLGFVSAYHEMTHEPFGMESSWTYRGNRSNAHTDYIFKSRHFETAECRLIDSPTDHRAVKAILSMKPLSSR